jgi:predicted transcriptional regulator
VTSNLPRKVKTTTKILEDLEEGPKIFTELVKKVKRAGKNVSTALKTLQKSGFVVKDVDTRKYQITEKGIVFLQNTQLRELMENGAFSAKYDVIQSKMKYLTEKYGEKYLQRLYGIPSQALIVSNEDYKIFREVEDFVKEGEKPEVFGKQKAFTEAVLYRSHPHMQGLPKYMPIGVVLIVNKEIDPKKLYGMIEKELDWSTQSLTNNIVDAVGKLNAVELQMSTYLRDGRAQNYDRIVWLERAYNFNLVLILTINGKELIKNIDWEKTRKKATELDEQLFRNWLMANEKMEKAWKHNKQKLLEDRITETLNFASGDREQWLDSLTNHLRFTHLYLMGFSEEEVLAKLAKNVVESPYFKGRATKQEVRTALSKKLEEGKFRIVPMTIYGIEKA